MQRNAPPILVVSASGSAWTVRPRRAISPRMRSFRSSPTRVVGPMQKMLGRQPLLLLRGDLDQLVPVED